jgi:hypothetical protein
MKFLLFLTFVLLVCGQEGLLPDLATVRILDVFLSVEAGAEVLRFSNAIANIGSGPLYVHSERYLGTNTDGLKSKATQFFFDSRGDKVGENEIGVFVFHPQHNHWHVEKVANYELYSAEDDGRGAKFGPLVTTSEKISFCLRDDFSLHSGETSGYGNAGFFTDCGGQFQGISPGWVDFYGATLAGQQFDVTGIPNGIYYLYSKANPSKRIKESNYDNNDTWVSLNILGDNGARRAQIIQWSACDDSVGLCGRGAPALSRRENETDEIED